MMLIYFNNLVWKIILIEGVFILLLLGKIVNKIC